VVRAEALTLDPQAAAWLEELRALGVKPYDQLSVEEGRRLADEGAELLFGEPDPVSSVEDSVANGVPVRIYRPAGSGPGVFVYLHGGGWVVGSLESHDRLCRTLAARSGVTVVAVGYRLAPEHRYPAAVEDAWTATRWAAARFEPVVVGGDSAGGHLAAVVALRARDRELHLALQVLVYPVTDHAFDTSSYREHGTGTNLTEVTCRWFWQQFLGDERRGAEPEASPLRAPDLAGVAPALVLTAEHDPLCDEGEAYAQRLLDAGVPTVLTRYEGQIHGFIRMPAVLDAGGRGIDQVAGAVRDTVRAAAPVR
jgi:acetyl esterase/lipase